MSESFHRRVNKKRKPLQADATARYDWMLLSDDEYVQKQLDAMVNWFAARKDVLDRVWLETHDHYGRPAQPFNMEAA